MKTILRETTHLSREFMDFGWGNGYVLIPKGHPVHGVHYDGIDVDVHYGLTFSEPVDAKMAADWELEGQDIGCWMVGFDTAHGGDTLEKWPMEAVQAETDRLRNQLVRFQNS